MSMTLTAIFVLLVLSFTTVCSQTHLGEGEQPQLTIDRSGTVRLVYGKDDEIYYSRSSDYGKTFSTPVIIGKVKEMHLGMTRGPQLASSRDFSMVTAMDKVGNIHSFRLSHKTGKWERAGNVNDLQGSAPEGLMSIAADDKNTFYAVWLDLRENRKNNICFSSYNGKSNWSKNQFAYKSPESHVCECCKPSIAVKGKHVAIMFRNWLKGSRDLYFCESTDSGMNFTEAQKLGIGTWPLKGCPMDGGGITLDSEYRIQTAWQRDGAVFYAEPGKPEEKIADGRSVKVNGNIVTWARGSDLVLKKIHGKELEVGKGSALEAVALKDNSILAVWEKDNKIVFQIF